MDRLLNDAMGIYYQYPIAVAVGAVILLFLIYKNQKASFKFAILLLVLGAFFYAVTLFGDVFSTGVKNRDQMVHKTQRMMK